jgi:hypothetical protein
MTPPSAIASKNMHANAGPDPESAVHASKFFSSRKRQRPIDENIFRMIDRSSSASSDIGKLLTTVIPSRIYVRPQRLLADTRITRTLHGVLGIARTTRVVGGTHPVSWSIVTPARMLMSNLPARASRIPFCERITWAWWGLQLKIVQGNEIFTNR